MIEGYPVPEFALPDSPVFVDQRVLGGPCRLWVGYTDGRPVSCSAAYTDNFVNGITRSPQFRLTEGADSVRR